MDQSETQHLLRLPVLDCPQFDADLRSLVQHMPTAAELAARALAANAPSTAPVVPMPASVRSRFTAMRAEGSSPCAEMQWRKAPQIVRRILVAFAELREANPGQSVQSMADRDWAEMPVDEQRAISQAVRLLMHELMALHCISRER